MTNRNFSFTIVIKSSIRSVSEKGRLLSPRISNRSSDKPAGYQRAGSIVTKNRFDHLWCDRSRHRDKLYLASTRTRPQHPRQPDNFDHPRRKSPKVHEPNELMLINGGASCSVPFNVEIETKNVDKSLGLFEASRCCMSGYVFFFRRALFTIAPRCCVWFLTWYCGMSQLLRSC